MTNEISGKEYPLSKIFSKEFEFFIPGYQRPYAWTEKEVGELFDDLYDAFSRGDDESYFLGSIVLIKDKDHPEAEVIDGQQRLTTLTMLLAVVSPYVRDKETWNKYLIEKGNIYEGISEKPRVCLRERDRAFFEKYIQKVQLKKLYELSDIDLEDESQKLIKDNCRLLADKLEEYFKDHSQIENFGIFIINRAYLIAVSTPDKNAAFKIFSIMNDRGMNLLPIDIIKAEVIGNIAEEKQEEYTEKWEKMEDRLKRQAFNDLIIHTRMIFAKTKARENILDEFKESVQKNFSPEKLIDDVLTPYADAYARLIRRDYSAASHADEINSMLFWLNKIDNSDWMPTAIKFFAEKRTESDYILWFVEKYERLVAFLYITASDRRKRIERYRVILEEMERIPGHCLEEPLESIELSDDEKKEFIDALNGEIYKMSAQRRNYIILRLNCFLSDGANKFDADPKILTIEHVLPQTIKQGSEWEKNWPAPEVREQWLNRIANLVPLTKKKNSAAQNYDFDKKKEIYFSEKNGVTTYPMTTQVIRYKAWLPEMMPERQDMLIGVFKEKWGLNIDKVIDPVESDKHETDTLLEKQDEHSSLKEVFYLTSGTANATGVLEGKKFRVLKDSKMSDGTTAQFNNDKKHHNAEKRDKLIRNGIVVDGVFINDWVFNSSSEAARILLGRSANGKVEWHLKSGETLKAVLEKRGY